MQSTFVSAGCIGARRHDHVRHQRHEAAVRPRRRNRSDEVVVFCRLTLCVATAGVSPVNGDRLGTHLGVDDGGEDAGELDSLALDGAGSGQIAREGIGAGAKVNDPHSPVASVTAVRTFSVSTALDASKLTPGSTAPECP
jgi:hypothetical protein